MRDRLLHFDCSHVVRDAIEIEGGRDLLARLQVARRGWVDQRAVLAAWDRMRSRRSLQDWEFIRDATIVWTVAAVELWLRALEEPRAHVESPRERVASCP